jgi:NifB/MoaA-like Fe-S oxidoreductase
LGVTFAFLADEIYIKAGKQIPSRRHYGNYPQIEDGVGMVRSFVDSFGKFLKKVQKSDFSEIDRIAKESVRTHKLANFPTPKINKLPIVKEKKLSGSILTGEMFALIFAEQIAKLNSLLGTDLRVIAVPNNYFGGDVAVAGLLTASDLLSIKNILYGDFAIIPLHTIKSDEPIFLDGMSFDTLSRSFPVPIYPMELKGFMKFVIESVL